MKLTEPEMRMAYQLESTSQEGVLNKLYMTCRYSRDEDTKATAESLMAKIRPLSDKECMALVNDVQKNYHLPGKARTIGEMLAEARQKSGAEKLAGHDIMALERFAPDTRHMIVLDVLSHESPMPLLTEWKSTKPQVVAPFTVSRISTFISTSSATTIPLLKLFPKKNALPPSKPSSCERSRKRRNEPQRFRNRKKQH